MKTITVRDHSAMPGAPHGARRDERMGGQDEIVVIVDDENAEAVLGMLTVACEDFASVEIYQQKGG